MGDKGLPVTNESGYYEMRLESIGGLGANLCGKMLGELGIRYLGLNSTSFSSYGSEKTGTPVKAFIRYCEKEKEIRVHAPVVQPHVLAVFHEALIQNNSALKGCSRETKIILNTALSPKEASEKYNIPLHQLYCIHAQQIAIDSRSRINVVMLGSIGKAMGFVPLETLLQICKDTLGKKYPNALMGNLDGIRRGYEEVQWEPVSSMEAQAKNNDKAAYEMEKSDEDKQEWGYETAPVGGTNPRYGNSVINDLSPSRQGYIPLFIREKCINCGMCDSTCPDMVFQFQPGEYKGRKMMVNKGLDYYHCKGCLRCVDVCPVNALVRAREDEYPNKPYFMPNRELLRPPAWYEATGADGYITSESFLTEERIDGGEV